MKFDEVAQEISKRQYQQPQESSIKEMLTRAARVISSVDEQPEVMHKKIYDLMINKIFCPGGRILAGGETPHGNLLNCFVQDGSPYDPGTTEWVMNLAKKLALVTKVGGGNGINLDPINPKREHPGEVGKVFVTINSDHSDYHAVKNGTYLDLTHGERRTFGYQAVTFIPKEYAPYEELIIVPDDTAGIWEAAHKMVRLMIMQRNVLIDLSELRSEGKEVKGSGGESSGPASFAVEVFDNFARWGNLGGADYAGPVATLRYVFAPTLRVIRQGGTRRGAGMATLSALHEDLNDFITCKDLGREKVEGEIGTFNISVLATEYFMESKDYVEQRRSIAQHAWESGEPGLIFVDAINNNNPLLSSDGPILATNPCGEVPLYPGEPCDLGAINLSALVKDGEFDWPKFGYAIRMGVRALDNILTAENSPLPTINEAIKDKRRIGLGLMGLADALIRMGITYGSEEAIEFAHRIARVMSEEAVNESEDLGQLRGIPDGLKRAGLERRNIALLTVAPTGTTAMIFGVTSGIEPLFSPLIYRRVGSEYIEILHPLFKEIMSEYGWDNKDWTVLKKAISDNHGSVQGLPHVPIEVQNYFVVAHDVEPWNHILMQAAVQRGFDYRRVITVDDKDRINGARQVRTYAGNSISKTINLPEGATVDQIEDVFWIAYYEGCKGCTVYRNGSRSFQVLNTSSQEDEDHEVDDVFDPYCQLDGTCDS